MRVRLIPTRQRRAARSGPPPPQLLRRKSLTSQPRGTAWVRAVRRAVRRRLRGRSPAAAWRSWAHEKRQGRSPSTTTSWRAAQHNLRRRDRRSRPPAVPLARAGCFLGTARRRRSRCRRGGGPWRGCVSLHATDGAVHRRRVYPRRLVSHPIAVDITSGIFETAPCPVFGRSRTSVSRRPVNTNVSACGPSRRRCR